MEYLIGVGLAVVVCAFATLVGFDRDRVFYPMLVTVIATYYILFAVIGNSTPALALESLIAGAFLALAVAGFKKNLWLIVAALAGHGVFDFFHHMFIQNPGVPVWWPGFCLSFDILAGGFLAMLLMRCSGFASKVLELRQEPYAARGRGAQAYARHLPPPPVPLRRETFPWSLNLIRFGGFMARLREQLQRIKENSSKRIPTEFLPIMKRAAEELRQSGIAERSPKVGDRAPEFSLPDAEGKIVSSAELLRGGPLVVSFYRGKW